LVCAPPPPPPPPHKVFARPFEVERSLSRSQARAVGRPALGSGIRPEAPLAPSLATFDFFFSLLHCSAIGAAAHNKKKLIAI
jgi:hypothetical protein